MYSYKGFTYQPYEDVEDDNIKIFHDVKTPSGTTIMIPLSPYCKPTEKHFQKWVEAGCPTEPKTIERNGFKTICNWDLKDIDYAYSQKF